MKAKPGQFYYQPHRNCWGVWVYTHVSKTGAMGSFIKDFTSLEEARVFVWKQNGWGTPKNKLKYN